MTESLQHAPAPASDVILTALPANPAVARRVGHGMLANIVRESAAIKLLYAAQVAHNTLLKRSPKPIKHTA